MNPTSRIETFNQGVRSFVTVILTVGFIYGFWATLIGPDIYATMFATVLGFWFGSRDQKSRAGDVTTTTETASGGGNGSPATTKTTVAPAPPTA